MLAISDERVDSSVSVPKVAALWVGTSEALGVYAFGSSSSAFDLTPGTHRQRRWLYSRRGRGGESTGRAIVWAARLEEAVERSALGCC